MYFYLIGTEVFSLKRPSTILGAKITAVAVAGLLFAIGAFLIFYPEAEMQWAKYIVGPGCILMGGARLFGYFCNDLYRLAFQTGFAAGAFCILIGILFIIAPENALTLSPYVVGFFAMIDGLIKLQTAMDARTFGMSKWVILIISAVVVVALGFVTVILSVTSGETTLWLGLCLLVDGAENMWDTMYTVRVRARKVGREISERFLKEADEHRENQ